MAAYDILSEEARMRELFLRFDTEVRRDLTCVVQNTDKSVCFDTTQKAAKNIAAVLIAVQNKDEFLEHIPKKHFAEECELSDTECRAMSRVWSAYVDKCSELLKECELGLHKSQYNMFLQEFSDFLSSIAKLLMNGPVHISVRERGFIE